MSHRDPILEPSRDMLSLLCAGEASTVLLFVACLVAVCLGAYCLRRRVRRWSIRSFVRFARCEQGAAYPLSVVLVLPFYVIIIATITECSMIMVTKLGTVYAAFAAARSASVWLPAEVSQQQREEMIQLAASQAIAPFASGRPDFLGMTGVSYNPNDRDHLAFHQAYQLYSHGPVTATYLSRKRQFALVATKVEMRRHRPRRSDFEHVTVRVTYEKPIEIPVVGLFLGGPASWPRAAFRTRRVTSEVTLQLEQPLSANQRLGINYDSWDY